jgi:hypothetical protein
MIQVTAYGLFSLRNAQAHAKIVIGVIGNAMIVMILRSGR